MFQTISDALKAKLETLKGTGQPFVDVFDYHTINASGFPFVSFEATDFTASILDTCNNLRNYTFTILVFSAIEDENRGEAVEILTKGMDSIITALDEDFTLGGAVSQIRPVAGRIEPLVVEGGKTMVGTIIVDVETVAFIR